MGENIKLSEAAKRQLEIAIQQYKDMILLRISQAYNGSSVISPKDIEYAVKSIEKNRVLYNDMMRSNVKYQRISILIITISVLCAVFGLLLSIVGKSRFHFEITQTGKLVLLTSICSVVISSIIVFVLLKKRSKLSDKEKKIAAYMDKWYLFENLLREQYSIKGMNETSFADLISCFLGTFDEAYPSKAKDFQNALLLRNQIAHNESVSKITSENLNYHIRVLGKLIDSVKNKIAL